MAHTTSQGNLLHDDDSHLLPVDFGMVAPEGIDTGTVLRMRHLREDLVVVPVATLPAAENDGPGRRRRRRGRRRCCARSLPAAKKAFRGQNHYCTCS